MESTLVLCETIICGWSARRMERSARLRPAAARKCAKVSWTGCIPKSSEFSPDIGGRPILRRSPISKWMSGKCRNFHWSISSHLPERPNCKGIQFREARIQQYEFLSHQYRVEKHKPWI